MDNRGQKQFIGANLFHSKGWFLTSILTQKKLFPPLPKYLVQKGSRVVSLGN